MSRAKLVQAQEEGMPLAERIGAQQDLMGKTSCLTSTLTNAAFKNRAVRFLMEKGTGIDRRWIMPSYAVAAVLEGARSGHRTVSGENGRAILFTTCFVEYSEAATARAALEVLEHSGVAVEGGYQACCGAPFLHGGDLASARKNAAKVVAGLIARVREGVPVVVPGPTCSLPAQARVPRAARHRRRARGRGRHAGPRRVPVQARRGEEALARVPRSGSARIAYHLPCHLKAQNIGFRSHAAPGSACPTTCA